MRSFWNFKCLALVDEGLFGFSELNLFISRQGKCKRPKVCFLRMLYLQLDALPPGFFQPLGKHPHDVRHRFWFFPRSGDL